MTKRKKDKQEEKLIEEALELERTWEPSTPAEVPNVRAQFRMPPEPYASIQAEPAPVVPLTYFTASVVPAHVNGAHKADGDITASLADQARLRRRHG